VPLGPAQGEWRRAVIENRGVLAVSAVMLVLAVLATFFN
jgi:hypothetical protein